MKEQIIEIMSAKSQIDKKLLKLSYENKCLLLKMINNLLLFDGGYNGQVNKNYFNTCKKIIE